MFRSPNAIAVACAWHAMCCSCRLAMELSTLQRPLPFARRRHKYALLGVAVALAVGLGTPALAHEGARAWSLPFETALVTVGALVALAFLAVGWSLGRRLDALVDESRRDPVTQIGNRRHWEECLAHEVDRTWRARMPLSVLVLDVDHLKELNDTGGHDAGDRALSIVGEVLGETCRSRDVAARFGGDEFAVLLPRTRASEARVVAERIRASLADRCKQEAPPLAQRLTVSIGVCDLSSVGTPHPRPLFEAADRALYAAKRSGRDRVEVYEKPSSSNAPTIIYLDERRRSRKRSTRWSL